MSLSIAWLSVFADVPADRLEPARAFWEQVTGTAAGSPSGAAGEYIPLRPPSGDTFLWLQRVAAGEAGGWHPDLHVADPGGAAEQAVTCGARVLRAGRSLVVLTTPGGQPFCLVCEEHPGPRRRPAAPAWAGNRSLADQLCLDIPADRFAGEASFWSALTGWSAADAGSPEFARLNPPAELPGQFLLQRLGADDDGGARAHLDLSADDPAAEVRRHVALGAATVRVTDGWTTLRDPAGLLYCVTHRRPADRPG